VTATVPLKISTCSFCRSVQASPAGCTSGDRRLGAPTAGSSDRYISGIVVADRQGPAALRYTSGQVPMISQIGRPLIPNDFGVGERPSNPIVLRWKIGATCPHVRSCKNTTNLFAMRCILRRARRQSHTALCRKAHRRDPEPRATDSCHFTGRQRRRTPLGKSGHTATNLHTIVPKRSQSIKQEVLETLVNICDKASFLGKTARRIHLGL
jgi:hypothetical protein